MKNIALLFTGLFLINSSVTFGKPIDERTAKQVGQVFLSDITHRQNLKSVDNLELVYISNSHHSGKNKKEQQTTYFYVFNAGTSGFVIVSGDDNLSPILGYSYESAFDPDHVPQNVMKWFEGYKDQIRYIIDQDISATEQIQKEWESYYNNTAQRIWKAASVDPLVQTKWNQGQYYNALCPGSGSNRSVTGCVATAMAQIMKYWNYPTTGTGFHSYTHQVYGTLSANFGSTTYQWSSMPNNVSSSNNAVATLMYHCGVSVDMDYSPEASGAYVISAQSARTHCAEYAFKTYFGYKNSLQGLQRSSYNQTQWINLLKNELESGRPILYAGFGSGGGHAFVCDGFDNNNYFHFNWGWGGAYDGYFSINELNPSGTGIGGGTGSFNDGHQALIGIEPPTGGGSTTNSTLDLYSSLNMPSTSLWFGHDEIALTVRIANYGTNTFSGSLVAAVFNSEGVFVDFLSTKSTSLQGGYYIEETFKKAGGPPFIPGKYSVAIFYKTTQANDWTIVGNGNYYNYKEFNIIYSADIEAFSNFTVQNNGGRLIKNESASVNVDVLNTGSTAFYGKFRVSLSNLDGSFVQAIQVRDLSDASSFPSDNLPPDYHYTNGLTFTGNITVNPGTYLMELAFQRRGESNWYYAGSSSYQNPVFVIVEAPIISKDSYEPNDSYGQAYTLPVNFSGNRATINTTGSNFHVGTDIDYYKINLPSGYNYTIRARLHDSYNSGNGNVYTADGLFSYSINGGSTWSEAYDDVLSGTITVQNGGNICFLVAPYFAGETGTYLLDISIDRTSTTNIENSKDADTIRIYPNPTQSRFTITNTENATIQLYTILGQEILQIDNAEKNTVISIDFLPQGVYVLKVEKNNKTSTHKIWKSY